MSELPSLDNPPTAPKKAPRRVSRNLDNIPKLSFDDGRQDEGRQANFWRHLADQGHIREKYLTYVPEDIPLITDYDFLMFLRSCYFPASQPRNHFEAAYCDLMLECIEKQIAR